MNLEQMIKDVEKKVKDLNSAFPMMKVVEEKKAYEKVLGALREVQLVKLMYQGQD